MAQTLVDLQRSAIVERLESVRGDKGEAARSLGISRSTLWRRLRAWGIDCLDRPIDREQLLEHLFATDWRVAEVARRLGVSRSTVHRRMRAYGLARRRNVSGADAAAVDV